MNAARFFWARKQWNEGVQSVCGGVKRWLTMSEDGANGGCEGGQEKRAGLV